MNQMETIYYDLLKRNLETRRLITLSTLGLVTGFGVIVVGKVLEGQDILNYYDSEFSRKAKLLVGAVAIGWMVFFMAYGMLTLSIRALISKGGIPKEQQVMVRRHSLGYSYLLPFLLSAILTASIILPLEQRNAGEIMKSWFGLADTPAHSERAVGFFKCLSRSLQNPIL
ncbi:hypothetical protein ACU8V1_25840 (plasmid) [Rhizobium leguminosarum]